MSESARQVEFITANKLQTANGSSLLGKLQLRGLRVCFCNDQISIILKERRAVLNDHRHLANSAGKHSVKPAEHLHRIRFTAIVNAFNIFYTQSSNKGIHSIDLLTNRIKQHTRTSSIKSEGDAGETGASAHIKEMLRFNRKVTIQCKRIDNMQNQGVMNILDASKVHDLVNLVHIKKVLHTALSSLNIKFDVELRSKVDNLSDKSGDLIDRLVKRAQSNGSGYFIGHMYQSNQ